MHVTVKHGTCACCGFEGMLLAASMGPYFAGVLTLCQAQSLAVAAGVQMPPWHREDFEERRRITFGNCSVPLLVGFFLQ